MMKKMEKKKKKTIEKSNNPAAHLSEDLLPQVHDFLWRPRALDGGVGKGENGVTALNGLQGGESLHHISGVVVGAHLRVTVKCLL